MGKTAGRLATRMCLPFYSLSMKIMTFLGVCPPKEGTTLPRQRPISLHSLQMRKGHPSSEKAKKSPSKPPKSESSQHTTRTGQRSVALTVIKQLEIASPHILEPQPASTQPRPSISHSDRLTTLIEGLHECISSLANVIYFTNNHVQIRLTTFETQLDEIKLKLEESL